MIPDLASLVWSKPQTAPRVISGEAWRTPEGIAIKPGYGERDLAGLPILDTFPGAPPYLPTPLQGILFNEMHARVVRAQCRDLYSFPVGQSVTSVNEETSVREVMLRLQTE